MTDIGGRNNRTSPDSGGTHGPCSTIHPTDDDWAEIVESLSVPAIVLDAGRRVQRANAAFAALHGPQSIRAGRHCYEVLHGLSIRCSALNRSCPLDRCLFSKGPTRALHVHTTAHGIRRQLVYVAPCFASPPRKARVLAFFQDAPPAKDGLSPAVPGFEQSPLGETLSFAELERVYLKWLARSFRGSRRELAKRLGVSERSLYRRLRALRRD